MKIEALILRLQSLAKANPGAEVRFNPDPRDQDCEQTVFDAQESDGAVVLFGEDPDA